MLSSRPILSTSDKSLLKSLEPFCVGHQVAFVSPNRVCGTPSTKMMWMANIDAEIPYGQAYRTSWVWATDGYLDQWEESKPAAGMAARMDRLVGPDLDVDILGRWYIPRTEWKETDPPNYVLFGQANVYPMHAGGMLGKAFKWPPVVHSSGETLLCLPGDQLWKIQEWMTRHAQGNTQIWWLKLPEMGHPVALIRGMTDTTAVNFAVSGVTDSVGGLI